MNKVPELSVYIIDNREALENLKEYVISGNYEYISFDLETDSVNEKTASIYGIGISFTPDEAFYIPIKNKFSKDWWVDKDSEKDIYQFITLWIKHHKLIGWNLVYDTLVFENNTGRRISDYIYSDGILQKHCIDEERPFGLKEVAVKYLGSWADKAQSAMVESIKANGGRTTKENMDMFKADTEILGEYCGWDTLLARRLFDIFETRIKEEGLYDFFYREEVMPLYKEVTIDMKRYGFHVDLEYFKRLKDNITEDIEAIENSINDDIKDTASEFEDKFLNTNYPYSRKGSFPKYAADYYATSLPIGKNGSVTLAKSFIEAAYESAPGNPFFNWMMGHTELAPQVIRTIQYKWFTKDQERDYVFNLKSNDHLAWLLFEKFGETPASKTETGKPQIDDDYLESIKEKYSFVAKLLDYKKLNKLLSTYVDGILDRQIDGVIYTSFLQFGTTSGRYSSANPNLQNLPRPKGEDAGLSPMVLKYVNAIRGGFVAPEGYVLVDADQSALEPRCFAAASGDENLKAIFFNNEDMYSSIAMRVFGISDASPYKKDKNFFGDKYPELRQKIKTMALAVTYGAEAGRIADLMKVDYKEAQMLIDNYLDAYPSLRDYIARCHLSAKKKGFVKTKFGRIRHLPQAKDFHDKFGDNLLDYRWAKKNGFDMQRRIYKQALNNSTNMPIQGLAAHVMNRSAIAIARKFKEKGIQGYIASQVHDQLICVVKKEQAEEGKVLVQDCMQRTVEIGVPLVTEPKIAHNMRDSH